jgi:hypothetical protein
MNRNEFNKSTTNDLGKLYIRFRKYQDALKKVNSEKSFRKIIENMANDVEFKITMEENPGLLRQEMLNAANRAGILGKNRKDLVKKLVFKKGGILKAQKGMGGRPSGDSLFNAALFSRDALGVANYLRANKESKDLYVIDKNIADITGRRTVKAPNILTNRRFMTNTNNQYNDLIGKYNTSIGQQITNDAFANMTARLIGADKTADIMRDMNRELSAEFNNAQDR